MQFTYITSSLYKPPQKAGGGGNGTQKVNDFRRPRLVSGGGGALPDGPSTLCVLPSSQLPPVAALSGPAVLELPAEASFGRGGQLFSEHICFCRELLLLPGQK